ncbi:MAG: type II secretion system protein [Patescibacteria group bacterium]
MKKNCQSTKGIGLIEVIVALTIIFISFFSFLTLAQYSLRLQEQSKSKLEAINLTAEAIEATRAVRDENWTNFASLSLENPYYPIISENKWTLSSVDPGLINGIYARWIIMERVYRDDNDNISDSGAEDNQTKKITAFVEWNERDQTKQINLITYLTNWNEE